MLAYFFLGMGAGLLIAGITTGVMRLRFVRQATTCDGVVVRLNAGGSHPQIEFTTRAQEKISYPQGGFIFGYKPGDRVTVLYDPRDAHGTACVSAPGALWFTTLLLCALGVFLAAVGVATMPNRGT